MQKVLIILLVSVSAYTKNVNFSKFNSANHRFATSIYQEFSEINHDGNFMLCPLSAEIVLALVQSGANNETGDEIRSALYFPNTTKQVEDLFKHVSRILKSNDYYKFYLANKIYIKEKFPLKSAFKKIASKVYKSEIANIDFSEKTKAVEAINNWVEMKTEHTITDIVSDRSLSDDTVALLINVLYFKGEWKKHFKIDNTRKESFYTSEENDVKVDTMFTESQFDYYESNELDAKFLKLPLKGHNKAKMIIALPNKKDGLDNLENQMKKVLRVSEFIPHFVNVALPKFKIKTTVDLKTILQKLGIKKAFSHADLSGIAGEPGEVEISEIIQKTYIDVGEYGVEAASATAVHLHSKSLLDYRGEKKDFIANHPFIFYIQIKNIVIFVGRIVSPN